MADTPIANVGDVTNSNQVVRQVIGTQTNDEKHVGLNPDAGRLLLQAPDGSFQTTVASCSVAVGSNTTAFIHDPQ